MTKIFIEAKTVELVGAPSPFKHMYLVFQDDNGDEFVIRGGL